MRFLIFLSIGALAQFIDGSIGMGYGVTSSRLLVSLGVYPAIASASLHTAEIFTTFISGASHLKLGNVQRSIAVPLIVSGVIGGFLGAFLCVKVSAGSLKSIVNAILLLMGVIILYQFTFKNIVRYKLNLISSKILMPLGFSAAFLDALGGGGWGPITTTTLVLNKAEPSKAVGTVDFSEFFVTVSEVIAFLIFLGPEKFQMDIVLILMAGAIITAPLAAVCCKKLPPKYLGIMVGAGVILLSISSLVQLIKH